MEPDFFTLLSDSALQAVSVLQNFNIVSTRVTAGVSATPTDWIHAYQLDEDEAKYPANINSALTSCGFSVIHKVGYFMFFRKGDVTAIFDISKQLLVFY